MSVRVYTASTNGTAAALGAALAERLGGLCLSMAEAEPPLAGLAVFVVATFGQGGVPEAAKPFLAALESRTTPLDRLSFGIVGLGDSAFRATYNNGHRLVESVLIARGAQRLGEPLLLDASRPQGRDEAVDAWAERFRALIPAGVGAG